MLSERKDERKNWSQQRSLDSMSAWERKTMIHANTASNPRLAHFWKLRRYARPDSSRCFAMLPSPQARSMPRPLGASCINLSGERSPDATLEVRIGMLALLRCAARRRVGALHRNCYGRADCSHFQTEELISKNLVIGSTPFIWRESNR